MTESGDDAHEDDDLPFKSTTHSGKCSAPILHDATVTRRPRFTDSHGANIDVSGRNRIPKRLLGISVPHVRPTTSVTTSPNSNATSLKAGGNRIIGPDPSLLHTNAQASASTIGSMAIQDLEGLLNEALHITQVAVNDRDDKASNTSPKPVHRPEFAQDNNRTVLGGHFTSASPVDRSPSSHETPLPLREALNAPAGQLDTHPQEQIEACGPVHQDGIKAKSSTAGPEVSYVWRQDWAQPLPRRRSLQQTVYLRDHKRLPVPAPASTSLKEPMDHVLRRKASKRNLPCQEDGRLCIQPSSNSGSTLRSSQQKDKVGQDDAAEHECTKASKSDRGISTFNEPSPASEKDTTDGFNEVFGLEPSHGSSRYSVGHRLKHIDLNGCRHVDVKGPHDFSVHDTCRHQPIARDWAISRKRFAATIACINTALIGIIIGIYAGEVPAIQYVIVDLSHDAILGNVFLYLGLAIPTLILWPLPLMHGRKPYTVMALVVALCLQIPQGMAVSDSRSPYVSTYRRVLLFSRAGSGFVLGFVNINLQATLLDLFGASLQSGNPYQEVVDPYDVRRHGGGMGLWLGLWSWCAVGSISIGFLIGTVLVEIADVSWGFWTSLVLMMVVLLLNVVGPEVRRSAYRRTVAEFMGDNGHVSRVSRGELKMHLKSAGPYWWGEEVKAGMELNWKMLRQPGFAILAIYTAWAYAHFTLILMLLGALASQYYQLKPVYVGLCVLTLGVGALLATPFQQASLFSRARYHRQRTDSMTIQKSITWSSHLLRRATFTLLLPFAGLAYALASRGSSISLAVPTVFAGCVGFLSNLAIAECQGIIMEAFDTSDLQPGMTGRPTRHATAKDREQRTNFTCYPRVSAGFAVSQSLSFCFAAIATGICGRLERRLGAMQATGIVAGALMVLTLLLTVVLLRFRTVRMIPDGQSTLEYVMRSTTSWEPVVLGQPSGTMRRISILETGDLTRWSEIRRRNRLTG